MPPTVLDERIEHTSHRPLDPASVPETIDAMPPPEPLIRNISDTARWAAIYRARETERPDAVYRDPFARMLAGTRGDEIASSMPFSDKATWSWVTRTYLFDQFINEQVQDGVDMVVNLAAGLDTRPYRLALPATLQWIEIDLPELLTYKEETLANDKPVCRLERIRLDLANVEARREVFAQLGQRAKRALIVSEGLIIYLTAEQVGSLAEDLAKPPSFQRWVLDLASPGLLQLLQKNLNPHLAAANAPLQFGPEEGPPFFEKFGWKPLDVRSLIKSAAKLGRLTLWMRFLSLFPESHGKQGKRPWSAVCLMERNPAVSFAG
jgi:methyltransferase (TIGR00027 family)